MKSHGLKFVPDYISLGPTHLNRNNHFPDHFLVATADSVLTNHRTETNFYRNLHLYTEVGFFVEGSKALSMIIKVTTTGRRRAKSTQFLISSYSNGVQFPVKKSQQIFTFSTHLNMCASRGESCVVNSNSSV